MLQFIKRMKEAREATARELANNPQDSSSGKSFKQLYKLGDKLGQGAFSVVKEGTHRQSGLSYAIKIVNKYQLKAEGADHIAALKDEITILREIHHHSHIVDLYDVFDDPSSDYVYLCTEKIIGGSLYERISKKGRYNETDGRLACKTIFEAIAFTHDHAVAHRDLKLENLLLVSKSNDFDIKIIDFGFAKKVTSADGLHTLIGTPGYVAPCILEGVGYGTKADVWALGVILYCMLSGYQPFRDANRQKLFQKIRRGRYEFHEKKWSNVSDDAKDLVRLLLTVDPSKRITAGEALEHRWITTTTDSSSFPSPVIETKEEVEEVSIMNNNGSSLSSMGVDLPAAPRSVVASSC